MRVKVISLFACLAMLAWTGGLGAAGTELCSTPDLVIPDAGDPVEDSVVVDAAGTVVDVNVFVDITHSYPFDLDIIITSPNGTSVQVSAGFGDETPNLNVIFDDEGKEADDALGNCGCAVQPFDPLSAFIGESAAGSWTIVVHDLFEVDEGTLNKWCLNLTTCTLEAPRLSCEGGASSATLSWDALPDSTTLTILRNGDGVVELEGSETSYTDSGLAAGAYFYQVVAFDGDCEAASRICVAAVDGTALCQSPDPSEALITFGPPLVSTVEVVDDIDVIDVQNTLQIKHTWIGDLIVDLSEPSGTTITVFITGGGDDSDDVMAIFGDSGLPFLSVPSTCACLMAPAGPGTMADLIGESPVGTWTLTVADVFDEDDGVLTQWCLALFGSDEPPPCPLVPPELSCKAVESTVTLSWGPVESDGFIIVRDGEKIADTSGAATSFVDEDVEAGEHTYELISTSDDPPCSVSSEACGVEVAPGGCPLVPPELSCKSTEESVTLTWGAVESDGFTIVRNGEKIGDADGTATSFLDDGLANGDYSYELISTSIESACSVTSNTCSVVVAACPLVEPELSCKAKGFSVTLTWGAVGSDGFIVVRNGEKVGDADGTATSFVDEEVEEGEYDYELISFNITPSCSVTSNPCSVAVVAPPASKTFVRGDANGNGTFQNLPDPIFILSFQFLSGPAPPCFEAADVNGNGSFSALGDAVYGLTYAFLSGPAPPAPFPECGEVLDANLDLGCEESTCDLP